MMRKIISVLLPLLAFGLVTGVSATPRKDIAGFWTLDLKPGWNLVAFPVLPDDPTPQNVIGNGLGAVEVASWDRATRGYRRAAYDPKSGNWSGDLYRLDRGAAYWIHIVEGGESRSLTVTGHPEEYNKFRWESLGEGWRFYAPTFGKAQGLDEIPPDGETDLLFCWNADARRFEMAAAVAGNWSALEFDGLKADRAYIAHSPERTLRSVTGDLYNQSERFGGAADAAGTEMEPPWPVVVGNLFAEPICYESGNACNGAVTVSVVREKGRVGLGGTVEVNYESIGNYRISLVGSPSGRFQCALTVGTNREGLQAGDRVRLIVSDGHAKTESESFEIPADANFVRDVRFTEPMRAVETPDQPVQFALGQAFPNPFNDRFQIELQLPQGGAAKFAIYDLSGRAMKSETLALGAGRHRLTMDAGSLPAGIYLIALNAGANRGVTKVAHIK